MEEVLEGNLILGAFFRVFGSSLAYCDLVDTCVRGPQVKVVMPQFGLCQMFVGLYFSFLVYRDVKVTKIQNMNDFSVLE